jgi:hypothetical protein
LEAGCIPSSSTYRSSERSVLITDICSATLVADFFVGDTIQGTFNCRKSKENSRELDVEIHYQVIGQGQEEKGDGMATVGVFRVR